MRQFQSRLAALRNFAPVGLSYIASSGSLVAANAAQLLTFAILARSLGPSQFGLFVQFTAVTSIAIHLCGLGASDCLVRRVAQQPSMYPIMLGHNLLLIGATGAALVALGLAVLPRWIALTPDAYGNLMATGLLLVTNIVLVRVILLAEQIFIAHSRLADANRAVVGYAGARTITTALACFVFGVTTVEGWAAWQFAGNAVVVLWYALWLRRLGAPRFVLARDEIWLGVLFSSQFLARAVRQNSDLFIIGLVSSIEVVGSYGVARRIMDSSYLSIEAMNRMVYPKIAAASVGGVHHAMPGAMRILVAAVGVGTFTALGIFVAAPYLPYLFGHEYTSLVTFVRIMSGMAILIAIWAVAMDVLGASGHQGPRATIVNSVNLLGAGLVAWATWKAPPMGTLAALYVIEIGTVAATWATLIHIARRSEQRAAAASAPA